MTTAVRERPILFSGPMVRAILEGHKTQTRRPLKRQPSKDGLLMLPACPFVAPGDLLWVRETWQLLHVCEDTWNGGCEADRLDGPIPKEQTACAWVTYAADGPEDGPWRPSIHMPRWASRLTLRVTDVRVEQLRNISVKDAFAEGVETLIDHDGPVCYLVEFQRFWNAMYAKRGLGWGVNPWVWVVEFEKA